MEKPTIHDPDRRRFLHALITLGALGALTGCASVFSKQKIGYQPASRPDDFRELMDPHELDRLEKIVLSEHKIYELLTQHSLGLALEKEGRLIIGGQAVVVPRVGPDGREIYRAVLTNAHLDGKKHRLIVLPNEIIPEQTFGLRGVRTTTRGQLTSIITPNILEPKRLPFVASDRWVEDERYDISAVAFSGVRNQSELYSLPSVELDTTPLRPGEIVFCLNWTNELTESGLYQGLWVNPGIVMRPDLLARLPGRTRNPGEVLIAFSSRAGNSGGGIFRIDPEHAKVRLVGLLTEAYDRAAIGIIARDAITIQKFLSEKQHEINSRGK